MKHLDRSFRNKDQLFLFKKYCEMNFVKNLPNTELKKKLNLLKQFIIIFFFSFASLKGSSQTSYTWKTTAANSSWNDIANWTPSGVPVSGDNVVIVNSTNIPVYDGTALNNFTLTSGNIDLGSNELTINGIATFTNGIVTNGNIKAQGSSTVFSNGTFNCKVSSITSNVSINGGIFNDSVAITKTGTTDQNMNGNAVFNAPLNLRITNTGRMLFAGNMVFNGVTSIYNAGLDNFILENSAANAYNNDLYLTIAGNNAGDIRLGVGADVEFKGDVYVNSENGTGDIYFAQGATRQATLAAGKKIIVGSSGFNRGTLWLQRVTQVGSTAQNISLTGTAVLRVGPATTFNGKINFEAPQMCLDGVTANDSAFISKTGSTNNSGIGGNTFNSYVSISNKASSNGYLRTNAGNTFNGVLELNNASVGDIILGVSPGAGSTYNGDVILNKTGNGTIYMAYAGNNTFAGNIEVSNITNVGGVYFCYTGPATATLAAGKQIKIGTAGFSGGILSLARVTQVGSAAQNLALTGVASLRIGPATTFNGKINFEAPRMYLDGVVCNDSAVVSKIGASNDVGLGNNIFNGFVSIVNAATSTGYLRTNAGNTFNGVLELNNASNGDILLGQVTGYGSVYNGKVYVTKSGTGYVYLAYTGSNSFNEDIEVSSTSTVGGIYFGYLTSASATLAMGKTIKVGAGGFVGGILSLARITQLGSTPQSLLLTGNSSIVLGPSTIFNGKIDFNAPQVLLSGITANDSAYITKSGSGNNTGVGGNTFNSHTSILNAATSNGFLRTTAGNTFNGVLELTNASSNEILFGLSSGSTYNGDVYLSKTGTGNLRMCYSGTNTFNGDIELNSTSATGGITFCEQVSASATLASGKRFVAGAVTNGLITIQRFTQIGSTRQDFNFSGNASLLFGTANNFDADVNVSLAGVGTLTVSAGNLFNANTNFSAPQLLLNGATFVGSSNIYKTGATTNNSLGGNKFLSTTSITNNGTGSIIMGTSNADTFAQKTVLTNTNAATIQIANSHTGKTTYFGDTLIVDNTSNINTGYPGVRFTEGNNTYCYFNGVVIATNSGTGANNLIRFQNGTGETVFNRRTYFNNNSSGAASAIRVSYNGNTIFNDNAYCTATDGYGVSFGYNNGTSVFAPTYKIIIGDAGFNATSLQINRVTQSGRRTPITLELSGSALLNIANSTFGEETDFIAPQISFVNNTFDNVARITKTGAVNNSNGGNTFNDSVRITNASSANLYFSNGNADTYNGDATFVRTGSGTFDPVYNREVEFKKNIAVEGSANIVFNSTVTGIVKLSGDSVQEILSNSTQKAYIRNLKVDKNTAYPVVLSTPVDISSNGTLTLSRGIVKTDTTNILTLLNNASANMGSANAFVDGLLNYQMTAATTRTLNFPIGSGSDYHPLSLTVRHNAATNYTYSAQLKNESARDLGRTLSDSIDRVSNLRYWTIERLLTATKAKSNANLVGNQAITLYYDLTDVVEDAPNLRIVKNTSASPNKWISIGGSGSANGTGFITSTSTPSAFNSFSDFTFGNLEGGGNPLPVTLVSLTATAKTNEIEVAWETATELNNKGFSIQRSTDGRNFQVIGWVDGNGTTSQAIQYTYSDVNVQPNTIYYYRLKQIDYDEHTELTKVVSAVIQNTSTPTVVWGTISPNANASANLILNLANEGVVIAKTFSLSGALISSTEYNASKGLNQIEMNFEQILAQGMYITEVSINNETKKIKWFYNK
ncbi:MAG: hypothetical protein BGO32_09005 [Bacteroidetes bacterium 37-13]|nr:MAG: hypothetical protein BGO32_09005 [Bacteroidetes bacterium 37-13]